MNYLGNVQFIAELFKLRMVSDTIIHECIRRLLRATFDETSLECVAILFTVAGKYLDKQKAKVGSRGPDHGSARGAAPMIIMCKVSTFIQVRPMHLVSLIWQGNPLIAVMLSLFCGILRKGQK